MKSLSDITAPVAVVRHVLEADLQDQCVRWYRGRIVGAWARKFSSISQRSVPDYLFGRVLSIGPKTKFACEFKKPGAKKKFLEKHGVWVMSTEAQYEEQVDMRLAGWFVFECDNFETFKATVIAYEKEQVQ